MKVMPALGIHILGQVPLDDIAAGIAAAAPRADADVRYTEDLQRNQLIAGTLRIPNPFLMMVNEG